MVLPPLPGGKDTDAAALNVSGQVVGDSDTGSGSRHAVLWQNGSVTDPGTLGGKNSYANDINNNGQIVGVSDVTTDKNGNSVQHAFLWQNNQMQDLGTLPPSSTNTGQSVTSQAYSINDTGAIVGVSLENPYSYPSVAHPVLWQNGQITDLVVPSGQSSGGSAVAIANQGLIIGVFKNRYFVRQNSQWTDLNGLSVIAVNDAGALLGYSSVGNDSHGYLWQNGQTTDLGALPQSASNSSGSHTYPSALNNKGQVVGYSNGHAFLWQNGVMSDLNTMYPGSRYAFLPDPVLDSADGINNVGQIAGSFRGQPLGVRAYGSVLLTPK